jgi:hypothetical protein
MNKDIIQLSVDFSLPVKNLLSQKLAFMGSNGSGKTYGLMKILEEILRRNGWVIVFDPVGIHYGLRLDESGKKPSDLTIPVFGGLHGDVPLTPESGKLVADLLFEKRLSAVLDVSMFTDPELNLFAANFAEQFYRRMQTRKHPVSIVLEECQEFIPQNPQKGEEKKLHHFTRIGKLGRNYGIGLMMVSPRPQEVNKKVLNLTQLMFAFQMGGPQERKAMGEWFDYVGFEDRIDRILPTLEVGCPYVSSPRWLKFNGVIKKINKKSTFDTSSTPDFDEKQSAALELTPIDIAAIQESMQAVIEQSKAGDPKLLRQEIEQLKRQLRERSTQVQAEVKIERVEVPVLPQESMDAIIKSLADLNAHAQDIKDVADKIESYPLQLVPMVGMLKNAVDQYSKPPTINSMRAKMGIKPMQVGVDRGAPGKDKTIATVMRRDSKNPDVINVVSSAEITGPMQRILDAIAWLESIGIDAPMQVAVAFLAGYTFGGGAYNNPRGKLNTAGLVEYVGERIRLTDAGRQVAQFPKLPLTVDEMHRHVMNVLPGPHQKILRVLLENYPNAISKADCASMAGYAQGGAFNNPLGKLHTMGLVAYPQPSYVVAESLLFLE